MVMKKIIGFLLLIGVIVWGCSDDDEKRVGDYELPSDFFYQTVWKGNLRYMTNVGWDEEYVGIEFVSDSLCFVQYEDDVKSALYFVEGKINLFAVALIPFANVFTFIVLPTGKKLFIFVFVVSSYIFCISPLSIVEPPVLSLNV